MKKCKRGVKKKVCLRKQNGISFIIIHNMKRMYDVSLDQYKTKKQKSTKFDL